MTPANKLNRLASQIARKEGKKSQARIGDIREILKIMVDLEMTSVLSQVPTLVIHERAHQLIKRNVAKKINRIKAKKK